MMIDEKKRNGEKVDRKGKDETKRDRERRKERMHEK